MREKLDYSFDLQDATCFALFCESETIPRSLVEEDIIFAAIETFKIDPKTAVTCTTSGIDFNYGSLARKGVQERVRRGVSKVTSHQPWRESYAERFLSEYHLIHNFEFRWRFISGKGEIYMPSEMERLNMRHRASGYFNQLELRNLSDIRDSLNQRFRIIFQ